MKDYHIYQILPLLSYYTRDGLIIVLDKMISQIRDYVLNKVGKFDKNRCIIRMNEVMYKRFMEVCSDDYRYNFAFNPVALTYQGIEVICDNRLVSVGDGQIRMDYKMEDIKMTATDMVDSLRYKVFRNLFDVTEYCKHDAYSTEAVWKEVKKMGPNDGWNGEFKLDVDWKAFTLTPPIPKIKKVIFHNPATIVFWDDGTKTVVKAQEGDGWNSEKGLAMAIVKKTIGLKEFYNQYIKAEGDI